MTGSQFVCPHCARALEVRASELHCASCGARYPVQNAIPRFVPPENYSSSFGLQWNRHRRTQLDSEIGQPISEKRLFQATGWPRELRGTRILEAGSGAGRDRSNVSTAFGSGIAARRPGSENAATFANDLFSFVRSTYRAY